MTWIDGTALGIVVLSASFSMVRGFVRELLSVIAWIGAAVAAVNLFPGVEPAVNSVLPLKNLVVFVSAGLVFVVALIVLSLVAALLGSFVRDSALSGLDRSLGLIFGAIRGIILVCAGYIALSVGVPEPSWPAPLVNARLLPVAFAGATDLASLIPDPYRPKVDPLPSANAPGTDDGTAAPAGSALRTE